jgi:hypothetical protein
LVGGVIEDRLPFRPHGLLAGAQFRHLTAQFVEGQEIFLVGRKQPVVRLLVKEVLIDNDVITIRHSIPADAPTSPAGGVPLPSNGKLRVGDESYLLRSGSALAPALEPRAE